MKAYTKKSHVRESANDKIFGFVISLILILFAVITAIPLISEVAVSLSSKTASQMNQINLLPVGFTFDSWKYLFMKGKIWMPFLISVFSTVLGVAIALLLNVLMAYPLSKTEFRPSKYIMLFVVFTMVFAAPKVPYFLTLRSYGLYNNYWVLILPHIMTAYNLIIVRTFFKQFPRELEEAAMIDGCTPIQTFFKIVLPIAKPTCVTVTILQAMWIWNDYLLPSLVLDQRKYKTVPMAVQYLKGGYGSVDMGAMMGTLVLAIVPIIIFYLFCQRYIIEGVVAGAVKG